MNEFKINADISEDNDISTPSSETDLPSIRPNEEFDLVSDEGKSRGDEVLSDVGGEAPPVEKREDGRFYDAQSGSSFDSLRSWGQAQSEQLEKTTSLSAYYERMAGEAKSDYRAALENDSPAAHVQQCLARAKLYISKAEAFAEAIANLQKKLRYLDTQETAAQSEAALPDSFEIEKTFGRADFLALPEGRREGLIESMNGAPDMIKKAVEKFLPNLPLVEDCEMIIGPDGRPAYEVSYFDPSDNTIHMDPSYDQERYTQTFTHEFGHFTDHQLGDVSSTPAFKDALNADRDAAVSGSLKKMLKDLASGDAIFDENLSDILSGTFLNDPALRDFYYQNGAAFYMHDTAYWTEKQGPKNAYAKEVFAELFTIYSDPSRADSVAFIEKYFPNTCNAFKQILNN